MNDVKKITDNWVEQISRLKTLLQKLKDVGINIKLFTSKFGSGTVVEQD